jgi:hypothetical protein
MKQAMINYVKNKKHDHFDTPAYAVYPLLEYIPPEWVIWEPTDTTGNSEITRALRDHGNKVISTSQETLDFLTGVPDFEFDCIITNPPYTLKNQFIKKCYERGSKWAMLMPLTALEGVERGQVFRHFGLELLVLDRRVEFTGGACWFNTSWFCSGILPQNLMFSTFVKGIK